MSRTLSSTITTNIESTNANSVWLVTIELDGSTKYYNTGTPDIVYGGHTYIGNNIVSLSSFKEILELNTNKISLTLTGVNATNVSQFESTNYVERKVNMWFASLDSNFDVTDTYLVYTGYIDTVNTNHNPKDGNYKVSVSVSNPLFRHSAVTGRLASDSMQKRLYPGDTGFYWVNEVQEKKVDL